MGGAVADHEGGRHLVDPEAGPKRKDPQPRDADREQEGKRPLDPGTRGGHGLSSRSIRLSMHLLKLPYGFVKNPAIVLVALHPPFDTPFTAPLRSRLR